MSEPQDKSWEQQTLEKVVLATVKEQRVARRWKIFFRSMWFLLFACLFAWLMGWLPSAADKIEKKGSDKYTALIRMVGEISSVSGEGFVTEAQVVEGLRDAFEDKHVKGIILEVNSPGGSPVAANRIYNEIRALRKKYPEKPIYTVVDEICASGCYYAASATDQIFVDPSSVVGSIGVLMNGFGFTGTMEKLGIERRLITAGKNKGMLDPFSPMSAEDKVFVEGLLEEIYQQFIQAVKNGRGSRLKETEDTFSGKIWSGTTAINMGLVDGQGTVDYVAKNLIKAEEIVDFTHKRTFSELLADQFGSSVAAGFKKVLATKLF